MTIGIVQQAVASTSATAHTTQTATFGSTPTNGNTIVLDILVWSRAFERAVNVPAGWVERHRVWTAASCVHLVCTRVAGAAEPTAVAVTFDSTSSSILYVYEVNGAYAGGATALSTLTKTHSVPSITPGAGVEALLMFSCSAENPYSVTVEPSGYSVALDLAPLGGNPLRISARSKHVASTSGSYTGSITYASNVTTTRAHAWFVVSAPAVVAGFTGTPLSGVAPLEVAFTDTSSGSPDTWAWDFGDGGTSTSQNPTHEYLTAGTYDVELTASLGGSSDTTTKTAYVLVSAVPEPGAG